MKLLSIGNSFSQDAQRYLHNIATADGNDITCANLFIGGCSLERHSENIMVNAADYDYEINGNPATEKVSIANALTREKWDVVTIQQVSQLAGKYETFEPFMSNVLDVVRTAVPNAKVYFHETWAYEVNSDHPGFKNYDNDQELMYSEIHSAVSAAASKMNLSIIPVGTAIQLIRNEIPEFNFNSGGRSINRDGFHLSFGYGRYAAGMVWYGTLMGRNVAELNFVPLCEAESIDSEIAKKIRVVIAKTMDQNNLKQGDTVL